LRGVSISHLPQVNMQKSPTTISNEDISESDGYTCLSDRCGRVFSKPIQLTDLSHRPREETYHACPFCFSRVEINEIQTNLEAADEKPIVATTKSPSPLEDKTKEKATTKKHIEDENKTIVSECPHQLGYLKNRSKGEAIPDKCFTCDKILQCMS